MHQPPPRHNAPCHMYHAGRVANCVMLYIVYKSKKSHTRTFNHAPYSRTHDTRALTTRMQLLMGRLAATKGRVEFNGDLHREYGYRRACQWTTSNAPHYWRARILNIKLAISREHIKKISDKLRIHHSAVNLHYYTCSRWHAALVWYTKMQRFL